MINTRLLRSDSVLKTALFFGFGVLCGAAFSWLVCWNVMSSLMGIRAQADFRAVDAATDAYDTAQTLSLQRLGETAPALQRAETHLDLKTIEVARWMKGMKNPKRLAVCNGLLGQVKTYRAAQPSPFEFKTQAAAALSGAKIPPQFNRKSTKRGSPISRFYQSRIK